MGNEFCFEIYVNVLSVNFLLCFFCLVDGMKTFEKKLKLQIKNRDFR